jgi:hypothetical protein
MSKTNGSRAGEGVRFAGILLPSLLPLIFKLGRTYLRFKKDAQKAAKIFEKELRANGMDKQTAREMTEVYISSSKILSYFDFSDMMSRT